MDFHCSLIPVPPVSPLPLRPTHEDGILNGDTKATLVAWGDDITFLDRDEDNRPAAAAAASLPQHFEHRA